MKTKYGQLATEMEQVLKETRKVEKIIQEELATLDKSAISHLVVGSDRGHPGKISAAEDSGLSG